ncbi:MAG TPA: serine/threonine-protein kinase [Candidatus Angelobacter sp.]|nr:serine/threonine-protein kinase [Candidatus Angelobacter sp.]
MTFLPDRVVARLRTELQLPDLSGTRYRVVKFLGRGGMGEVWLAEDTVLERSIALKILSPESGHAELASRLMREAVVLARLEHPGIVPVHDAGVLPDGRAFYCMKYVAGQTLDKHITGMDLHRRLQLLLRITEPLAFAHSRGIIHRDLKPGNVMVGPFGEVLILDWGLAKIHGNDPSVADHGPAQPARGGSAETETAHGAIMGTPGFMAPEQARGETSLIDHRADIFALGAIMAFMLRAPDPPARPLQAIYNKAMDAEISARYASVGEMAADIERNLQGLPVTAYRENLWERASRLAGRNRVAIVLVLAYLLMRILFVVFSRR